MTLSENPTATVESPSQTTSVHGDQDRSAAQPVKIEETPDKPTPSATINSNENNKTTPEPPIVQKSDSEQTVHEVKQEEYTHMEQEIKQEEAITPADTPVITSSPAMDPHEASLNNPATSSGHPHSAEQNQTSSAVPFSQPQHRTTLTQPPTQASPAKLSSTEHSIETLSVADPSPTINSSTDTNKTYIDSTTPQPAKVDDTVAPPVQTVPPAVPEQSTAIADLPTPHPPASTQPIAKESTASEDAQPTPAQQQEVGQQPSIQTAGTNVIVSPSIAVATAANTILPENQPAPAAPTNSIDKPSEGLTVQNQLVQPAAAAALRTIQQPLPPPATVTASQATVPAIQAAATTTKTTTTTMQAEVPAATITTATASIPATATTATQPIVSDPSGPAITVPPPQPATTFEEIQKQLKATLDHIEQRNMVSGFQTLSKATGAVVDSCEHLGLTSDDHPYNAIDREQFWAGLNNCWLYALAQRQEPSCDAERLTDQHLYNLREMVVTWADKLERYGLVDYEMGWWEADILSAIDGILAMSYAAAQAAAQAVVAQAAAALFGDDVNM